MKGILKGKPRNVFLPENTLPTAVLGGSFLGHAGFPEATDNLAYDAEQRLLAVCLAAASDSMALLERRRPCMIKELLKVTRENEQMSMSVPSKYWKPRPSTGRLRIRL